LVVVNDVVKGVFDRLGMAGAFLLASALIFGAIGAGVIVHRLQPAPTASSTREQNQNDNEQGIKPPTSKPPTSKPPKHGHSSSPEPEDPQDKDA
jgi:hypothetical protein